MSRYDVDPRAGQAVLREAVSLARAGCQNTADLLARLAAIDEHRLYLPAGYDSMWAWCMGELPFSEDGAERRLNAARVARQFPAIFDAVAGARLHLTAVLRIAPHLTSGNWAELVAGATRQSRCALEAWLADRFPAAPLLATPSACADSPAPVRVELSKAEPAADAAGEAAGDTRAAAESAPGPGHSSPQPVFARLAPLGGDRFRLDGVIDRELHELLREAQELLGHAVPTGGLAEVLRHCVLRTVAEARRRAAEAKAARAREQERARERAAEKSAARAREEERERELAAAERDQYEELGPWLRALGFTGPAARRAAAACAGLADQSLEARIKHAASLLAPHATHERPPARPAA